MSAPLVQLSLKKGSLGNRFVRWIYRKYRNEEAPTQLNLCNAFWSVVVWGSIVLVLRALTWPLRAGLKVLDRLVPVEEYSYEKERASLARKRMRRERRKAIGRFIWTLLWPVRFIVRSFVRILAFVVVSVVSWGRKHEDGLALVLLTGLGLALLAIIVIPSVLMALESGWWAGLIVPGIIVAFLGVGILLVWAAEQKYFRFLKPVGRVLLWPLKLAWGLLRLVWIILVAVKYRLCPLVRVE